MPQPIIDTSHWGYNAQGVLPVERKPRLCCWGSLPMPSAVTLFMEWAAAGVGDWVQVDYGIGAGRYSRRYALPGLTSPEIELFPAQQWEVSIHSLSGALSNIFLATVPSVAIVTPGSETWPSGFRGPRG